MRKSITSTDISLCSLLLIFVIDYEKVNESKDGWTKTQYTLFFNFILVTFMYKNSETLLQTFRNMIHLHQLSSFPFPYHHLQYHKQVAILFYFHMVRFYETTVANHGSLDQFLRILPKYTFL